MFSTILLAASLRATGEVGAERVLDVGSGESRCRDLFDAAGFVGIDRRAARSHVSAFIADGVAHLTLASSVFDAVLCTEVIEHVPDERQLASELTRAAVPGARPVLSSPFVHGLHEPPYDFRRLTSIGLARVLKEHGWRIVRMASLGGPMVVAVDRPIRWFDPLHRRRARRLGGSRVPLLRAFAALSRAIQQGLAAFCLAAPLSRLGAIDPIAPSPRLTLGYVVVARLHEEEVDQGDGRWARELAG